MALTHAGVTYSDLYGLDDRTPFEVPVERTTFAGGRGVVELRDAPKGRRIRIPYRVSAASLSALASTLETIDLNARSKHGTLSIDGRNYAFCTFEGFRRTGPPRRVAGAGASVAFIQHGVLEFFQLRRTT